MNVAQISKKYYQKIDSLDLELIIAGVLKKPREFVLAHPEFQLTKTQETSSKKLIERRLKHEPIAYIFGHKEFYGLNFKVTRDTLIPRPETELLVEKTLSDILSFPTISTSSTPSAIIDIGTGSGNIIISIAKNLFKNCHSRENGNPENIRPDSHQSLSAILANESDNYKLFGIDTSKKALGVAKHNAKKNNVDKKIKFLHGNLLEPIIKNYSSIIGNWKLEIGNLSADRQDSRMIILANLPYLSKEIYAATAPNVKKFEPKSALYSKNHGLAHYKKLLSQIKIIKKRCCVFHVTCYMEISPEQKNSLNKLIKKYFPEAKIAFCKDLAKKWRVAQFSL